MCAPAGADSAHARSQAQWLRELIQAYTADLHKCQQDLTGYSRYSEQEEEVRVVGDQRHLAQKLHGVSAKQKEHLQGALNGALAALGLSLYLSVNSMHVPTFCLWSALHVAAFLLMATHCCMQAMHLHSCC